MMLRPSLVVVFSITVGLAGCRSKKPGSDLPPASGSSPPAIPTLAGVGSAGDDSAGGAPSAGDADHVSGTGTLKPRKEAQLGPKVSGNLTSIKVDEGDRVKKGEVLFTIDSSQEYIGVQQAKAGVQAAQVGYSAAELNYKRTKALFDKGSVAPATYDQVKAAYDGAKAQLEQAKAGLNMAQRRASDTVVRSPIAGVVTAKLKSVGETATMMPPTVVLVVQDIDVLELHARLPERALSYVKAGDTIHVHIPSIGANRDVKIKRVNPGVDPRSRTIEVVADLDNKDRKLKPGMLVEARYDVTENGHRLKQGDPAPKASSTQHAKVDP